MRQRRYSSFYVEPLKVFVRNRGIKCDSNKKDSLITALVLYDEFNTVEDTSAKDRRGSYSSSRASALKPAIHERLSGQGLHLVGEVLKNMYWITQKDHLVTILVLLDRYNVGHWPRDSITSSREHQELVLTLHTISTGSRQRPRLSRVDYDPLPLKQKGSGTFSKFVELTFELRQLIWRIYFQANPRVVPFAIHRPGAGIKMLKSPPVSMSVNSESRVLTLKQYHHEVRPIRGVQAYVNLLHFTHDTLLINDRTTLYYSKLDQPQLTQNIDLYLPLALRAGLESLAYCNYCLHNRLFEIRAKELLPALKEYTTVSDSRDGKLLIFEAHEILLVNYELPQGPPDDPSRDYIGFARISAFVEEEQKKVDKEYGEGKLIFRSKIPKAYKDDIWH